MEFRYCYFVSKRYEIADIEYYADWSKIINNWSKDTSISGRTIYRLMDIDLLEDVKLEFKFKNSIPSNFVVGFGTSDTAPKAFWFHYNGNYYEYYQKTNGQADWGNPISNIPSTSDTVFGLITENIHTVKATVNSTQKASVNTQTSLPLKLRIDDFTNSPMELEYLKIEKL